jgi:hypothetical protein
MPARRRVSFHSTSINCFLIKLPMLHDILDDPRLGNAGAVDDADGNGDGAQQAAKARVVGFDLVLRPQQARGEAYASICTTMAPKAQAKNSR